MRSLIQRLEQPRRRPAEKGFTLIELLVVIIILGILAAIVVFAVTGVGDKGAQASCEEDTRILQTAEEANFAQLGSYAPEPDLVANGFLGKESPYHEITNIVADAFSTIPGQQPSYTIRVQNDQCGQIDGAPDPAPTVDPDGAGVLTAGWPYVMNGAVVNVQFSYTCPRGSLPTSSTGPLPANSTGAGNDCGNVVDAQHPNNK